MASNQRLLSGWGGGGNGQTYIPYTLLTQLSVSLYILKREK